MPKKFIFLGVLGVLGLVLAILVVTIERTPVSTPVMRGYKLADELGCFACHSEEIKGGHDNPNSRFGGVLPFKIRGLKLAMIQSDQELYEWISYGAPKRLWKNEEKPDSMSIGEGVIKMPAFEGLITSHQIDDLVAYVRAAGQLDIPASASARFGYEVSSKAGCFTCHGEGGFGGVSNPGSFKGYIPPWDGEDYSKIVLDENELREWIYEGTIVRFESNPLARFFTSRQVIKMPPYKDILSEEEVVSIIDYIDWVRDPNRKYGEAWVDKEAPKNDHLVTLGETLYVSTGCSGCHGAKGEGGMPNKNTAEESVPSLDDLASKMQIFSRKDGNYILQLLDQNRDFKSLLEDPPIENFETIYETLQGTRNLIIAGAKSLKKDPDGPEPPMHMPGWHQRLDFDNKPLNMRDVDAIIAYLLSLQDWTESDAELEEELAEIERGLLDQIKEYRKGFSRMTEIEYSGMHWFKGITVLVNENKEIYKKNHETYQEEFENLGSGDEDQDAEAFEYESYPEGTIFVKEHFDGETAVGQDPTTMEPDYLTVMIKREKGYDPAVGDWQFGKLGPQGEVVYLGDSSVFTIRTQCIECHRNVSNRDYVFASYLKEEDE